MLLSSPHPVLLNCLSLCLDVPLSWHGFYPISSVSHLRTSSFPPLLSVSRILSMCVSTCDSLFSLPSFRFPYDVIVIPDTYSSPPHFSLSSQFCSPAHHIFYWLQLASLSSRFGPKRTSCYSHPSPLIHIHSSNPRNVCCLSSIHRNFWTRNPSQKRTNSVRRDSDHITSLSLAFAGLFFHSRTPFTALLFTFHPLLLDSGPEKGTSELFSFLWTPSSASSFLAVACLPLYVYVSRKERSCRGKPVRDSGKERRYVISEEEEKRKRDARVEETSG